MELLTDLLWIIMVLAALGAFAAYLAKKPFDEEIEMDDAELERTLNDMIEITQDVVNFRIFLMELRERIANGEVSTERARELVLAKKALAFDRIHRLVVLGAKKNDNSCGE